MNVCIYLYIYIHTSSVGGWESVRGWEFSCWDYRKMGDWRLEFLRHWEGLSLLSRSSTISTLVFFCIWSSWGNVYFSRSANNVLDTMGQQTAKHSVLLNQRCKVVMWYIQYMVLLQELLHPPRASRDDCGERIASVGTPLRAAFTVGLLLGFCAVFQRSLYKCSSP